MSDLKKYVTFMAFKFSIKDFFCKCDQIRTADLVTFTKKHLAENFIFMDCERVAITFDTKLMFENHIHKFCKRQVKN